MLQLNDDFAIKLVKELTITAMNNNMISATTDSVETANAVYDFYRTLFDSFTADEKN